MQWLSMINFVVSQTLNPYHVQMTHTKLMLYRWSISRVCVCATKEQQQNKFRYASDFLIAAATCHHLLCEMYESSELCVRVSVEVENFLGMHPSGIMFCLIAQLSQISGISSLGFVIKIVQHKLRCFEVPNTNKLAMSAIGAALHFRKLSRSQFKL